MNAESYTLVILHGWEHSKGQWIALVDRFEPGKIVVLDLPGFGREALIDDTWGIPEYSEWVTRKVDGLGRMNIILLGHSFGGRIAGCIASKDPRWLKGLILYGSPSLYRPSRKVKLKIGAAKFLKSLGFSKRAQGKMYPIFKRVVTFDQTKDLPNIKVPALLIWGKEDSEVPLPIAKEMNGLISGSRLIIIENAGHNAHLDQPDLFYGTIKKFVGDLQ